MWSLLVVRNKQIYDYNGSNDSRQSTTDMGEKKNSKRMTITLTMDSGKTSNSLGMRD